MRPLGEPSCQIRPLILRTTAPDFWTSTSIASLAAHGVRQFLDLRTDREVGETRPPPAFAAAGVQWKWAPIDSRSYLAPESSAADYAAAYIGMVLGNRSAFADVFGAIADFGGAPFAFGCRHGRDRTGVVAALVRYLLGITADDIGGASKLFLESLQARFGGMEAALRAIGIDPIIAQTIRAAYHATKLG